LFKAIKLFFQIFRINIVEMKKFFLISVFLFFGMPIKSQECMECKNIEGFVSPEKISKEIFMMVGKSNKSERKEAVRIQKQRGVTITGTYPTFKKGFICPLIDSEEWAISYTHKRKGHALHKGIDIPQPKGTYVLASASGIVVGKFLNPKSRKGIEIILRHRPEDTGLPFYTYTQYTHLLEMPSIPIGKAVKAGDKIAKIWNTGVMGKKVRRSALHFAVMYSNNPNWTNSGDIFAPQNGYFMDPVYFFNKVSSYKSYKSENIKNLSDSEKKINVAFQLSNGEKYPLKAKRIWPFACQKENSIKN